METQLSPYILLRKACLPFGYLNQARPAQTWSLICQVHDADRRITELRQEIFDVLYDEIAAVSDDSARRPLLNMRRNLKKAKSIKLNDDLERSLTFLPEQSQSLILELCTLEARRQSMWDAIESELKIEMDEKTRAAMKACLTNADFVHALSLNNPRLYKKVSQYDDFNWGKHQSNKSERTFFSYMSRAAAKTSPLSTFMSNIAASYEPAKQSKQWKESTTTTEVNTELNRGVIARIQRYCQQDLSWFSDIELEVNSSLSWQDQRAHVLASVHVELLGRPWRQQQFIQANIPKQISAILQQLDGSTSWLKMRDALAQLSIPQQDSDKLIKSLIENDVLSRKCLWCGNQEPLASLINALVKYGTEKSPPLLSMVRELSESIETFVTAKPEMLAMQKVAIEKHIDAIYCHIGARFVEPYNSSISETVWQKGQKVQLGKGMTRLAKQVADVVASRISVNPEHAMILDLFVQTYGAGGTCHNLLEFLKNHYSQFVKMTENRVKSDTQLSQKRIGVTLYGQLLTQDLDSLDKGNGKLVLNLLYERLGWQAARYLPASGEGHELTKQMTSWLQQVCANGEEPVEIALSAECNNLQSHQYVTKRVLAWPGESIPKSKALNINEISVRHDAKTNQLHFFDGNQNPIKPCYLGAVMPFHTWGQSYMLVKMTEPFSLVRPDHLFTHDEAEQKTVKHTARIEEQDLVLYRNSWRIDSQALSDILMINDPTQKLYQLKGFMDNHGIPELVYANADLNLSVMESQEQNVDKYRKPMWLDLANPICLDLLKRLTQSCPHVVFREALPDESQHWLTQGNDSFVSELQFEIDVSVQQTKSKQGEAA